MEEFTLDHLLDLLMKLRIGRIWYCLKHSRDDAIMVFVNVPGERWEIELLADGHYVLERFVSQYAKEVEIEVLDKLIDEYSDKPSEDLPTTS